MDYPPGVRRLLDAAGAAVGDRVRATRAGTSYEGSVMPHHGFSADDILTVKLDNGYNVGIATEGLEVSLVSKGASQAMAKPVRPADAPEGDAFDPYPDASDPDASVPDATVVILACPADMVLVETFIIAMSYCIDMAEAGNQDWVMAGATCAALGKRLCTDGEWHYACTRAPTGLVDMTDGDWEWTSDLASPTVARKRGWNACTDTSTHAITPDPYLFHCCRDPL